MVENTFSKRHDNIIITFIYNQLLATNIQPMGCYDWFSDINKLPIAINDKIQVILWWTIWSDLHTVWYANLSAAFTTFEIYSIDMNFQTIWNALFKKKNSPYISAIASEYLIFI